MHFEHTEEGGRDLQAFIEITESLLAEEQPPFKGLSFSALMMSWKNTIASGKYYSGSLFEWDKEVSVREVIEKLFRNTKLQALEGFYENVRQEVERVDEQYKEISVEISARKGRPNWWERRILKYGVGEYEEQVKQFYGIDLEDFLK